jgi:hypothetical protein
MSKSRSLAGVLAALVLATTAPIVATQGDAEKLMITALAVNMSNVGTSTVNQVVEIQITRWSTPEERTHLIRTMIDKGEKALLAELQKTPSHGRFAIPGWVGPDPHELRLGYDLHYAWQTAQPDGGRRIVIVTDRYMGFQELRARPRTVDYPFTLFEIRVDKNGNGEGKMAVATRISFDKAKNTMELENYSSEPVRLQNLKLKPMK